MNYLERCESHSLRSHPDVQSSIRSNLIGPTGKLVYAGAIDSKASTNPADIAGATNYVTQAIDETAAEKPVSKPVTAAYGCSVKYANAG